MWPKVDALLVQTACCYEIHGSGSLFSENKASILSVLQKRLQGLSGHVRTPEGDVPKSAVYVVIKGRALNVTINENGYYYVWLPSGWHNVEVMSAGFAPYSFSTKVSILDFENAILFLIEFYVER
ncbi:hypothetical protein AB6A40_011704 [Gnathostoma spinigerum]|uniref:Carboxypeptidase M n=1 Tax=Gnathostoma spinigerum TaxID=75299 RepID=A0ABD6EYF8_9BILA